MNLEIGVDAICVIGCLVMSETLIDKLMNFTKAEQTCLLFCHVAMDSA